MRKVLYTIVFLSIAATYSSAQNPEFYLILRVYMNDNLWPKALYIGYDPNASDSLEGKDSWFGSKGGEIEYPPPAFDDFRLGGQSINRPELGGGTLIDIRHKPDSASFQLSYEVQMTVSNDFSYASMIWDNQSIPPIIHNLILEPATISPQARSKTDMKQVSGMTFPNRDSISKYKFMILTAYYNRDAFSTVVDGKEAIRTLSLVANPVSDHLSALLYLPKPSSAKVILLDVTGRVVAQQQIRGEAGINPVGFDCRDLPSGAYKLVAYTEGTAYSQTVIVRR